MLFLPSGGGINFSENGGCKITDYTVGILAEDACGWGRAPTMRLEASTLSNRARSVRYGRQPTALWLEASTFCAIPV